MRTSSTESGRDDQTAAPLESCARLEQLRSGARGHRQRPRRGRCGPPEGVAVDEAIGLVYLSDMNSGLWIVERTD
jgi:hypothetical protein